MERSPEFADLTLYGELSDAGRQAYLGEVVGPSDADVDDSTAFVLFGGDNASANTTHRYGYIPLGNGPRDILSATDISPDLALAGTRVRVTLDVLRAMDYPGRGEHEILVDFSAVHQVGTGESIHFAQKFRVGEGEEGGINGYPIFLGLNVGNEGIAFKAFTVNVGNKGDRSLLAFLDSGAVTSGLKLLTTANPALGPLTDVAVGLTKSLAKRNENVPVQDIFLGLDLVESTHARLRLGTYVAVQLRPSWDGAFQWSDWHWNGEAIVSRQLGDRLPANYFAFSVLEYIA